MGDIWLPGLPPAYTDYATCLRFIGGNLPTHDDAVILAAIGGAESGYDYRVINDTPDTGDYSVGIFQINYYQSLYASRTAQFGTPRDLILSGPIGQCAAAVALWKEAGGFSPWQADITNNRWQKYVGSGPVPNGPSPGGQPGINVDLLLGGPAIRRDTKDIARTQRAMADRLVTLRSMGSNGWRP